MPLVFTRFKNNGEVSPLLIMDVQTCEIYEILHHNIISPLFLAYFKNSDDISTPLILGVKSCEISKSIHYNLNFIPFNTVVKFNNF